MAADYVELHRAIALFTQCDTALMPKRLTRIVSSAGVVYLKLPKRDFSERQPDGAEDRGDGGL
jgi:hypothetical protein